MTAHYQFDAYTAFNALKQRYADFLLDHFAIRRGPLAEMLIQNWTFPGSDPFRLFAPLIVQGAFPFKPGLTATSLRSPSLSGGNSDRPLHPRTVDLLAAAGVTYPLYLHQVEAIRQASVDKTIILSAGTGSGKTEAFLIPLIDRLFWEQEQGRDDLSQPGIRAIIVYPLNALVNNQISRLRSLLKHQSQLTFAYYTSRLKDTRKQAERFLQWKGEKPLDCEIIDRRTLRALDDKASRQGPPHILVTNYSMLEYMLVRPLDRSIFLHDHLFYRGQPRLRAVVLDEAHVYAGAQAAEIHMLLRRTAQRFATRLEDLQGFATSATLSQGETVEPGNDPLEAFATVMFAKSRAKVAVIRGDRYLPPASNPRKPGRLANPESLPDGNLVPSGLHTLVYENGELAGLVRDAEQARFAAEACRTLGIAGPAETAHFDPTVAECPALLLYHLYSSHPKLIELRAWLFEREKERLPTLAEVAVFLYQYEPCDELHCRAAEAVLRLGSLARREDRELPFIPVRMHALVRAPLGIWVDPRNVAAKVELPDGWSWGEISSMPPEPTDEVPRLELLLCPTCGAPYLEGWEGPDKTVLPRGVPEQQRVLVWPDEQGEYRLHECMGGARIKAIRIEREKWDAKAEEACVVCGEGMKAMRRLRLNPRAALGAIVDAIFPHLGQYPPSNDGPAFLPGGGRRLLSFSDSRQKAAEVATRVESTHDTGLTRQLLWNTLCILDQDTPVRDLVDEVQYQEDLKQRAPVLDREEDSSLLEDVARLCIYEEFSRPPALGNTLETLGLVEVVYPGLPKRPAAVSFLSDAEWKDFVTTVLDDARRRGAVARPHFDSAAQKELEELLPPKTIGKVLIWSAGTKTDTWNANEDTDEDQGETVPFYSSQGPRRMYHYAERVLQAAGAPADVDPVKLLGEVWNALMELAKTPRCKWLKHTIRQPGNNPSLWIELSHLILRPHSAPGWIEPRSFHVYFRSVQNVCPDKNAPIQQMSKEQAQEWRNRHSIRRVIDDPLLGLWSVEHTAQIDVDALEQEEEAFRKGRRNLLASSTTMEMGVDLGGLTFVLLTNVPPAPANYWQRAGRAGRRADGSSMVLTLALGRPHDQRVFKEPRRFFHAPVTAPRVRLDTPPLLQRHVNACLIAAFFEEVIQYSEVGNPLRSFGTVEEFLFKSAVEFGGVEPDMIETLELKTGDPLVQGFLRWLLLIDRNSKHFEAVLRLVEDTELAGSRPSELAFDCGQHIEKTVWTAQQDWDSIKAQRELVQSRGDGKRDPAYLVSLDFQERALLREPLIGYLARCGFLPSFGFPIDVVQLETRWKPRRKKDDSEGMNSRPEEPPVMALRMERPLAMALSEYAPGAEVIAGKRVYRVAGMVRNWFSDDQGAFNTHFYWQCGRCGYMEDRKTSFSHCSLCGHPIQEQEEFLDNAKDASKQAKEKKRSGNVVGSEGALEPSERLPSPIRRYLEPGGFAVKLGQRPKRLGSQQITLPPARVSLMAAGADQVSEILPGLVAVGFAPESRLFVRSEGRSEYPDSHGYGYRICRLCGYTEPESEWNGKLPPSFTRHYRLRGLEPCAMKDHYWRHAVLGTSMRVDAFRVRFLGDLAPRLNEADLEAFYLTFATCLQQKAAELLQVDSRTLNAMVGTWSVPPGLTPPIGAFGREAILYEESGSGMLALVADAALDVVRATVKLIEERDVAEFIRFDTQFLITQGKLRLDLLRQHFLEPGNCKAHLEQRSFLDQEDARLLRGRGPRLAALELLSASSSQVALQAPRLAADAFERSGLLRVFHSRALSGLETHSRLLLTRLPDPNSGRLEDMLLAQKLLRLLEDGVQLRLTAASDGGSLLHTPWRLIAHRQGRWQALGGMIPDESGAEGISMGGAVFGEGWIEGALPVEASVTAAELAWLQHETLWARAMPVTAEALTPQASQLTRYIQIREGSSDPASTTFEGILAGSLEIGPIATWGEATELVYSDRYVARNPVGLWMLDRLLQIFSFRTDAHCTIRFERQREDFLRAMRVNQMLRETLPPGSLAEAESRAMRAWCSDRARGRGLQVTFREEPYRPGRRMSHARKLTVRFAPGGKLSTLKVLFERGLDWVYPVPGKGPWSHRPLRAHEAHVVIVMER